MQIIYHWKSREFWEKNIKLFLTNICIPNVFEAQNTFQLQVFEAQEWFTQFK